MSAITKPTKISIVGTEGTGKTVFLAVLAHSLSSAKSFPRITGVNIRTRRYTAEVMDSLESGQWPPSTPVDVKRELKWCWYDRDGDPHELGTFDCAGQDFRAIFEAENVNVLSDKQRALLEEFHNSDLILLLLNLQDALNIYQKPGKSTARIDIEYAPSAALRKLRESKVTLYTVFTQADRYAARIQSEWNGNYSDALRDLLPDLYNALLEAGSQFTVVRAVETEEVHGMLVPKKEKNAADLGDIIRAVDDFFAKRKEEARQAELVAQEATARKRAEEEQRLREEEERIRKQTEEEKRRKKEAARREKWKQRRKLFWALFVIFVFVAIVAGVIKVERYNIAQEQERMERVAREEKAAAEAKKRVEEERVRLEQEQIRATEEREGRKIREEKAAATAFVEKLKNGAVFRVPEYDIDMQPIPAGHFTMGSPETEEERFSDETQHRVTISKPYWLGKYEVTQGQWEAVMGNNPSSFKQVGENAPVENVSWNDAKAFCDKLTERERAAGRLPEGYVYTLPTEAEWEYACRAGTTGPFSTGDNLTTEQANYDGNYSYNGNAKGDYRKGTTKVDSFSPNAWGLYDMHGNVREWCKDWYIQDYPIGSVSDPTGPASGSFRAVRGGAWDDRARICRSAYRSGSDPGLRKKILGFRLALSSLGNNEDGASFGKNERTAGEKSEIGKGTAESAPTKESPNIFNVNQLDQKPAVIFAPKANYPYPMRRARVNGEVLVRFVIDSQGNVVNPYVVRSTNSGFDSEALRTIQRWKFRSGKMGGKGVAVRASQLFVFTLPKD